MPRQHNPRPSIFSNFMKGSSKGKQPGKQGAMGVLGFMAVAIAISGVAERPAAAHLPYQWLMAEDLHMDVSRGTPAPDTAAQKRKNSSRALKSLGARKQ